MNGAAYQTGKIYQLSVMKFEKIFKGIKRARVYTIYKYFNLIHNYG
jgi:hypothetical protein